MNLAEGKRTLAWTLALGVLAGVLCVTPLFDVLGYEFCLALGLGAAFAGAHLGTDGVWRSRHRRAPSDALAVEARPLGAVAAAYVRALGRIWAVLCLPLLLVLLNGLRVRNCDRLGGLAWFVLLPMLSGALGAALGVTIALARPWRRRSVPTLLAVAAILGSIGWGVWRFYAAPPIFGFDPFVGYFAGTLYDEEIVITRAFVWARLYQLGVAATALGLCALFIDGETLSLRLSSARGRMTLALLPILFAIGSGLIFHNRARLGFQLDADDLARILGAEKRTAHFVLHYSPRGPYAREIDAFASDDEFRWAQLEKFFGRAPETPVHAFLFDNADDKRRLMGAAHTFIAKPWRREIYLQYEAWPQQVTMHELAHVFAGPFGDRLFGISRKGLHFNVGLIEGIAVAASWSGQPLTPHQVVKVLLDARLVNDAALAHVMSPRFFGLNAGQAYNLAGSFVRFLVDTRGIGKLEQLFGEAGSDESYERIYGRSFAALRDEWLAAMAQESVPPDEAKLQLAHLSRPSVFHRACAHALARARHDAQAASAAGDRTRALSLFDALCRDEPGDTNALAEALDAALAADARPEAQRHAEALLGRHDPVLAGRAEMALGDLALMRDDTAGARTHYARAATQPLDEAIARLVTVKQEVAAWPPSPLRAALVQFLTTPAPLHDQAIDLVTLRGLVDKYPDRPLLHYLLARQLASKARWAEVAAELAPPVPGGLPDGRFSREAQRIRAQALFHLDRYDEARAAFDALARDSDAGAGARLEAADWRERCDFVTQENARAAAATRAP